MWIEGLDRSSGVPAQRLSPLGMEVTDISQSRRNEFNIYSNDIGLSNQFYVSTYVYSSDFTLRGGDGAYRTSSKSHPIQDTHARCTRL